MLYAEHFRALVVIGALATGRTSTLVTAMIGLGVAMGVALASAPNGF